MKVKLGDILLYDNSDIYLVVRGHALTENKLSTVCLKSDDPINYELRHDGGAWTFESSIQRGHTRIIGNIFDKE